MIFFENKKDLKSERDNINPPPIVKSFFTSSQLASLIQKTLQAQSLKCLSLFYGNISLFPCSSTHLLDKDDDFFLIQKIDYQRNQFFLII